MNDSKAFKAVLAGVGGGMVASWAVTRFYRLSRRSSRDHAILPYVVGAGIGAAYVAAIHGREVPMLARVPLGAALWLAAPEKTAAPRKRGRGIGEKASTLGLHAASLGLKKLAERALSA
jgi:uncharacterized membrane protein YeaQ/YmgE (transglycosylase-associated protein family)